MLNFSNLRVQILFTTDLFSVLRSHVTLWLESIQKKHFPQLLN